MLTKTVGLFWQRTDFLPARAVESPVKKEVAGSADAQRVGVHELVNKTGSFSSGGAAATRRAMLRQPFGRPW